MRCIVFHLFAVHAVSSVIDATPYRSALNGAYDQLIYLLPKYMGGVYTRKTRAFLADMINTDAIFYQASEPRVLQLRHAVLIVKSQLRTNIDSPLMLPLVGVQHWLHWLSTRQGIPPVITQEIWQHVDTMLNWITNPSHRELVYGPFEDYYADVQPVFRETFRSTATTSFGNLIHLAITLLDQQLEYVVIYMHDTLVINQFSVMRQALITFIRIAKRRNSTFAFTQANWLSLTADYWLIFSQVSKLYVSLEYCGLKIAELETTRNANILPLKYGRGTISSTLANLIQQTEIFIDNLNANGCSLSSMNAINVRIGNLNAYFGSVRPRQTIVTKEFHRPVHSARTTVVPQNTFTISPTRADHETQTAKSSGIWNFFKGISKRLKLNHV